MAKIIATHSFGPGMREMFAQQGAAVVGAMKQQYPQVIWNGMYVEWDTGKAICIYDAPDTESVAKLLDQLETPYDDVFVVEWASAYDVARGV